MKNSTLALALSGALFAAPVALSFSSNVSNERLAAAWTGSILASLIVLTFPAIFYD